FRVFGVERMLRVDERRESAGALRFRDHMQRKRRFARRFRAEDLDDPAARHAADAKRRVDADRAGRDRADRQKLFRAEAHDRAFAELALDLCQRRFRRFQFVIWYGHEAAPSSSRDKNVVAEEWRTEWGRQAFVW